MTSTRWFLRVGVLAALAGIFILFAPVELRAQVTYSYQGNPFTQFNQSYACPPVCRITGSFTMAQPLASNLPYRTQIFPLSFNFTDGLNVFSNSTSLLGPVFLVGTDASGNITAWFIEFDVRASLTSFTNTHISYTCSAPDCPTRGPFDWTTDIATDGVTVTNFAFVPNSPGTWSQGPATSSCSALVPAGSTTDFTDPAAFAAATANPTKVGFANILPPGALFGGYSQLDVPGFSFSTPLPGTFVNITTAAYYSPHVYPQDFIVDSTVQGTGLPNPNNQLCVTLSAPAFAVALDLGGLGFSGLGSGAITLSNGHTFSIPALPTVGNTTFVGFVSTVPITNLTFATVNDSWVVEDVITATPTVNNCSLSLAPTAASFPARGGGGSFQVNTGAGCTWDATFNAPWIVPPIHNNVAIVGGFPPPAGPGGVRFWVTANPTTSARTGTISVGNQTFAVNQAGLSCSASINPSSATVSASGGSIRVVVDDGPSCSWSAASNVGWLTVTLGGAGTGNASVYIQASANTGGARTGTVTIAGQTLTVQQSAQSAPAQNACGAMDVTAQVNISHGQLRPDFISPNIWYLDITLTARPGAVPSAPAWLVLRGVPNHQPSPFDVTDNATYTTTCFDKGSGMFPIGTLQQGPVQLTVTFYVGNAAYPPPYNPIVLSGTPTR